MGRERRSSIENYDRVGSYTSPNRSPRRRERYSRTESHSTRARSQSQEEEKRYEDKHGTKKPAYGGPKEPLVLDSNIQILVNSRRSSSPIRPTSANRIVTFRPKGDAKFHNSNGRDRRYDRDSKRPYDSARENRGINITVRAESYRKFTRHDQEYKTPSPHRRNFSPYRGRRDDRKPSHEGRSQNTATYRNGRSTRSRDRRTNPSNDRRHESSAQSSRRNGYNDRLDRERNSKRRRYSRDDRSENDERSYSGRKKSYDGSEKSPHTDEHEDSENKDEMEDHEQASIPICGPVPVSIRPPMMWGPMGPVPLRPPPIFLPPRPLITPMGYVIPPRPRFLPFLRPPPAPFYPPRPLPPPPTL